MSNRGTPHLSKNRHGVYQYQRWLPAKIRKQCPTLKAVFRLSLHTRNKQDAIRLARKISVKLDDLALKYFDDAESFGKAMQLLYESAKAARESGGNFHSYEELFLSHLEGYDEYLYDKGEKLQWDIKKKFDKLESEIDYLKQAILAGSGSGFNQDEFLAELDAKLTPPIDPERNPPLSKVFEEWQEDNKPPRMAQSSFNEYVRAIDLFIRLVNDHKPDTHIHDLSVDHIKHYFKLQKIIPKGTVASKYTVAEMMQLKGEPKSAKTLKKEYGFVGQFLEYCSTEYNETFDNYLATYIRIADKIKVHKKRQKKRPPFTDEELNRLFNSKKYIKGTMQTSGMYWAPLIALFTGARMAEILQLLVTDIKKEGGIWYFDFDDLPTEEDFESEEEFEKFLKASGSKKTVPIHKQLLELGLLDYKLAKEQQGSLRLFPDEPRKENTNKFDNFQKRFTYYRKVTCNVVAGKMEQKGFHNFRHTVRTRLAELAKTGRANERFDDGLIDAIVGHSSAKRSIGESNYTHSDFLKPKSKALNRLQYDSIDFEKIAKWDYCEFWRKQFRG